MAPPAERNLSAPRRDQGRRNLWDSIYDMSWGKPIIAPIGADVLQLTTNYLHLHSSPQVLALLILLLTTTNVYYVLRTTTHYFYYYYYDYYYDYYFAHHTTA
jgi:hypothetical protein